MSTAVGILSAILGVLCTVAFRRMFAMHKECKAMADECAAKMKEMERDRANRDARAEERFSSGDRQFDELKAEISASVKATRSLEKQVSNLLGFLQGRFGTEVKI